MISLCYVIGTFNLGGAENLVLNILRHIDKSKFKVFLVVFDGRGKLTAEYHQLGIDILDLRIFKNKFKSFVTLIGNLRDRDVRCIHIHLTGTFLFSITAAKIAFVPKILIHWHNVYSYNPWRLPNLKGNILVWIVLKYSAFFADRIIAISKSVKTSNCKAFNISPSKVEIVYNGIDLPSIDKIRSERLNTDQLVIGSIGNVSRQKGHDILIQAISLLKNSHTEINVEIIGNIYDSGIGGKYYEEITELVTSNGLSKNITFLGSLSPIETLKKLKSWSIFVLASRWEGFGLVLIEAMACKVPIIASSVDAIPEIITDGVSGVLFKSEEFRELAEKLDYMLTDGESRNGFIMEADLTVRSKFSIKSTLEQLERIYTS